MSLKVACEITCDGCGLTISGKPETRSTHLHSTYADAMRQAERQHWLLVDRGRYRVRKHFCQSCADTAPTILKQVKRIMDKVNRDHPHPLT